MYREIWEKPETNPDFPDEEDIEFPQSEQEFKEMIDSMRREGYTD